MSRHEETAMGMGAPRRPRLAWAAINALLAAMAIGCNGTPDGSPQTGPATLELVAPPGGLPLSRPAVTFDHSKHTKALPAEGCDRCHRGKSGPSALGAVDLPEVTDRDDWMDGYHALCLGCHDARQRQGAATGPLGCGDCHQSPRVAESVRGKPRFDYSLHARHAAIPEAECGDCHHARDEATGKLVAKPGSEGSCRDCHGKEDADGVLSWRHSAHVACVQCHQARASKKEKAGPIDCEGCHDTARLDAVATIDDPPRPARGQPERRWLASFGEHATAVAFDHAGHEAVTDSCSSCHHHTMDTCSSCHTQEGSPKGGSVTLEAAQHDPGSRHSCTGCHTRATQQRACVGCHEGQAAATDQSRCVLCHQGADGTVNLKEAPPPPIYNAAGRLPSTGPGFPESITIDLPGEFGPSVLPHAKIVQALLDGAGGSGLARWFHSSPEALCAGCHHHSPVGVQPPACGSCHAAEQLGPHDEPSLKAAYHRACIGCHERMEIPERGCTDCHAATSEEQAR